MSLFGASTYNVSESSQISHNKFDQIIILWNFEEHSFPSNLKDSFPNAKHILFNAQRKLINEEHWITCGFQGVLYADDSAPLIVKAINWVANDQLWFSRKTLSQIAVHLIEQSHNSEQVLCEETLSLFEKLTLREQLIIQRLLDGYKNKEIAVDFAISEHTVKSHVYSIYKKIKARNRVHAINLAREFMPLLVQRQ